MAVWIPDIRQGDTYRLKFEYPVGMDLTGYKHWLTLKKGFAGDSVMSVSSTFGEHTSDLDNIAYLEVAPEISNEIASGRYYYDVQVRSPSGDVFTLLPPVKDYKDKVFVAPQVTLEA